MRKKILQDLQIFIDDYSFPQSPSILEAGCGSRSHVTFPSTSRIVGIDISEKQLVRNDALDERICGDIQEHDFPPHSFDVIICWDVLEHLKEPTRALDRFYTAIRPNGLIILGLPNVLSLWGLITKISPHWFHVWFYRTVFKKKEAGLDDNSPFPTFLRWSLSPDSVKRSAQNRGLSVALYREYDPLLESVHKRKKGISFLYVILANLLRLLSLGKLGGTDNSGYLVVFRKTNSICDNECYLYSRVTIEDNVGGRK
ncbi:MAG: class I SAM-dependent methyltransferase [Sedimentisphaerales bacterium]|nr:class I SAM-dependent methyltransferase [Sedimentisphaerales bacterium]